MFWLTGADVLESVLSEGAGCYVNPFTGGVECPMREYDGDDPRSFVVSLNLHRRHLNESQRAMVAANLANMPAHRPGGNSANLPTSQTDARLFSSFVRSLRCTIGQLRD